MTSVNEYRPTEYMQQWCRFWYDESARLAVAKYFQDLRVKRIHAAHANTSLESLVDALLAKYAAEICASADNGALLLAEARFSKSLYGMLARHHKIEFVRAPRNGDLLNEMLDAGNYLAYGFAACALWVLGISFAFGVNHGMTRRGALVFDVADLVKDALIMPQVFIGKEQEDDSSKNRNRMLVSLENNNALKFMLESVVSAIPVGLAALEKTKS